MGCGLFADDIHPGLPGREVARSRQHLSGPCRGSLGFALVNPFAWLLQATGRVGRSLGIGLVVTPVLILAYVLGLATGHKGLPWGFPVSDCARELSGDSVGKTRHVDQSRDVLRAVVPPGAGSVVLGAPLRPSRPGV